MPELAEIAEKFDLKLVSIEDLIAYRMQNESLVEKVIDVKMPTEFGNFDMHLFKETNTEKEHLAIVKGDLKEG